MNKTEEIKHIEDFLYSMGRNQKLEFLNNSNLNDRELELITSRFVRGLTLKECSENLGVEINTVSKNQHKAIVKLFNFLKQSTTCQ